MSDIAIKVDSLSKRYRIGVEERRPHGFWDAAKQAALSPFDYLRRITRPPTEEETLWALKDVSFEVQQGEVLGIIGRNGAGKSTLLKILSRITEPTEGRAIINGRVGSLLEVGTGFHPELTGRENVYLNGAILGMTRAEIDHKFDEIVAFSGVEKFIDTPVKRYSSGMYVRLAFAVAAHLEPEILLVDEVLAVGDIAFQKKCLGKMSAVGEEGRTVLFVSHSMPAVRQLCKRVILLAHGTKAFEGLAGEAISRYSSASAGLHSPTSLGGVMRKGTRNGACVDEVRFCDLKGQPRRRFLRGETARVIVVFSVLKPVKEFNVSMAIVNAHGIPAFSEALSDQMELGPLGTGKYQVEFAFRLSYLKQETYFLTIYLLDSGSALVNVDGIPFPEIADPSADSFIEARRWGVVRVPVQWSQIKECSSGLNAR